MKRVRIGSGLVGATSVAALNYVASRFLPGAPRLDVLGLQLVTAAFKKLGIQPPSGLPATALALLGSLASNSMFYGLVGLGGPKTAWLRGGALGVELSATDSARVGPGHGPCRANITPRFRDRQTRDRSHPDNESRNPCLVHPRRCNRRAYLCSFP